MKAYELSEEELTSGNELAELAKQAGYSSLTAALNDSFGWDIEVGNLRKMLQDDAGGDQ